MNPADDDDERLLEPQEAADQEREDHAQQLADEERNEDDAESDFEEGVEVEQRAGHYRDVLGQIHGIFRGNEVDVEALAGLSGDEKAAMRVLAEAVRGTELEDEGDMIYAEQRLSMLNQALAVLQPTLAMGLAPELADVRDSYDTLVDEVTALRDLLLSKEDAQEEMFAQDRVVEQGEGGDTDDDDDDETAAEKERKAKEQRAKAKPVESVPEPGQPARPSTLAGKPGDPAVAQPTRPSTAYDGDK